jgi:hypothetical protein
MRQHLLTPAQARKIILHAAGLSKKAPFGKGREAVYKLRSNNKAYLTEINRLLSTS